MGGDLPILDQIRVEEKKEEDKREGCGGWWERSEESEEGARINVSSLGAPPSSRKSRRLNPAAATASIRARTALGARFLYCRRPISGTRTPSLPLSCLLLLFVLAPRVAHKRLAQPMAEATSYPQRRSWSDIPLELAGLVLRRLPAKVDHVRFAAVCPQWHSAAQQVPLPMQP
ncbi:hypothetical protein EJB05_26885, partial [Eragrostis curvula]